MLTDWKQGPRQTQVLELLMKSYTNAAIATAIHMKIRTVKAHVAMLARRYNIKHGMSTRIAIAVAATLARFPELVPFTGGDRAQAVGYQSAAVFAERANYNATEPWQGPPRRRRSK